MKRNSFGHTARFVGFMCAGVVAILSVVDGANALAAAPLKHNPSAAIMDEAVRHNEELSRDSSNFEAWKGFSTTVRPFADYEKAGYVFISDDFEFDSRKAKEAIAANLPKDVTLVVFTEDGSSSHVASIERTFAKILPAKQLKVVQLADASSGFWARDGLPVPVLDESTSALALVDAKYYYPFEPDQDVGAMLGAAVASHKYNFEGGNFMANHKGHCVMVNNRSHSKIPDSIFETLYGCKTLDRLPHLSGIGHVDEHVRFVSEDTVLTDLPDYKKELEKSGLKVVMLPRPDNEIETYVNSLIVNGVAIVPTFGEKSDAVALKVYESVGLSAFEGPSSVLSNEGEGSIHCITMTYPPVPFVSILKALGAKELH